MSDHTPETRAELKLLERKARIAAAQAADTTRWIMSTPQGRSWMYDLLEACHIGVSPYTGDNDRTNFQCGEQNIGLRLWAMLQSVCPDLYLLMMQEHNQRELANASRGPIVDANGNDDTGYVDNYDDVDSDARAN